MADLLSEFDIIGAFWTTVVLTFFSAIGSMVIGTIVAILRVSPVGFARTMGAGYVNTLRNTPLTLIIVFCNLGLFVNLGVKLADPASQQFIIDNNIRLGILGLSVYHAAFVCEALRSGINTEIGRASCRERVCYAV